MTRPLKQLAPASEDLVRLRDEIAMHALNAMIIAKGWGYTDADGVRHDYNDMISYSRAAYQFADQMLVAREIKP